MLFRSEGILARGEAISVRDLVIGGKELMEQLGMKPGPRMGVLLDRLMEEVIEDPTRNDPAKLLARAAEILPELPEGKGRRGQRA